MTTTMNPQDIRSEGNLEDHQQLVAITFDDTLKAQEALLATSRLVKNNLMTLNDAAIVTKTNNGKIKINQTRDLDTGHGALAGSWWGLLAGILLFAPIPGVVLGAAAGGIWAKLRDVGINDDQMKKMGEDIRPGDAALFLLVDRANWGEFNAEMRRFDGEVLATTLGAETETLLEESLAVIP